MEINESTVCEIAEAFQEGQYEYISQHIILKPYIADLVIVQADEGWAFDLSYDWFTYMKELETDMKNRLFTLGMRKNVDFDPTYRTDLGKIGSTEKWYGIPDIQFDETNGLAQKIFDSIDVLITQLSDPSETKLYNISDHLVDSVNANHSKGLDEALRIARKTVNHKLGEFYNYITPDFVFAMCRNQRTYRYQNPSDPDWEKEVNRFLDIYEEAMKPAYEELRLYIVHRAFYFGAWKHGEKTMMNLYRNHQALYTYTTFGRGIKEYDHEYEIESRTHCLNPYAVYFVKF